MKNHNPSLIKHELWRIHPQGLWGWDVLSRVLATLWIVGKHANEMLFILLFSIQSC